MNPAVAALRHDLRTVVNHLLGYTEMLLEDADASGPAERVEALERVRAAAREILAGIDESLPATSTCLTPGRVATTGDAVRDPASRILIDCAMIGGVWASDPDEAADIARITTSARALLRFAEEGPSALGNNASATTLAESEPVAPAARDAAPASRILVADDDATNRDLLGRRLARLGHEVAFATDGREALALLGQGGFDLVLLDLMMPVLGGDEVLRRLRADSRLRDIPVLMISARDEHESVVRSIEEGADDYLPKPFDPVLLRARISACLERKRWRDQEAEYLRQVRILTAAAARLESGALADGALDEVTTRPDALGGLARVFERMAREVQAREQRLSQEVRQLRIDIDEARKAREVSEIVETDFFQQLQRKAAALRRP